MEINTLTLTLESSKLNKELELELLHLTYKRIKQVLCLYLVWILYILFLIFIQLFNDLDYTENLLTLVMSVVTSAILLVFYLMASKYIFTLKWTFIVIILF
jgi:hypothetical protein